MKRFLWLAVTVVLLLVLSIFPATIVFPPNDPISPRQLFLIDHGTNSSLAIETESGDLIRYAYGDMRYYANRDTSLSSGAAALLIPTPATLARAELKAPATLANLESQLLVVVDITHQIAVSSAKADSLISRLDGIYDVGQADLISVAAYGLDFVPHPNDYFWANNSSTVIATRLNISRGSSLLNLS